MQYHMECKTPPGIKPYFASGMRHWFICFFFVQGLAALSQPVLTLQEALRLGLEQNFDVRLAKNEVELARDGNTPGMAGFFPSISFNLGGNLQSSNLSQRFASGLAVDRPGVVGSGLNGSMQLNWLFFDGGKMFITSKRLGRQLTAAEIRLQNQVMGFADSLSSAYYQVVLTGLELKALEQSARSIEERIRISTEQERAGTRPASDAIQARMDLNISKNKILAQKRQIEIRKGALNLLIGREPDVDFLASDSVKIPGRIAYSDLKNRILEKNLGLQSQKEALEISRLGMAELNTRMLPQIGLNMALNYQRSSSNGGFALYNRNIGPLAGINLSLPIFNGVSLSRQLRMAGRELEGKQMQLKLTETRLLFQAWRNLQLLETSLESMDTEKANLELAQQNLRIIQDRFRLSLTTSLELREAENQLENSRIRLQQYRYQSRITANLLLRLSAELDVEAKESKK